MFNEEDIILDNDGYITRFAYQMIYDLFNVDCLFISNDVDLYTFCDDVCCKVYECECNNTDYPLDELCEKCQMLADMYVLRVFKSIEELYGISMDNFTGEPKIWRIADYVFEKLDEKELDR